MDNIQQETDKPKQKILKEKGLIVFIVILSAFIPLSMDLYMPALPTMARYFGTTDSIMNLTLILFFVAYAASALVWGPLSDKHGRRPMLLVGCIMYFAGSTLCVFSGSVWQMLIFRVMQAIGGGVTLPVSSAIVRETYTGKKQGFLFALVQSMTMICPVVAPVFGAFLLTFTNWRGVFVAQAIFGIIALILTFCFNETIPERNNMSVVGALSRLAVVIKNPRFAILFPAFYLTAIGMMAFIAASAYIYQDFFSLNSQSYSYFYAATSVGMIIGPMLYVWLSNKVSRNWIIKGSYIIFCVCGLLTCFFGMLSPWILTLIMVPTLITGSVYKPPATVLMLAQQNRDIGSAASLITFVSILIGCVGMGIVSAVSLNMIMTIGVANAVCSVISLVLWILIEKKFPEEVSGNTGLNTTKL